MFSLNLSAARTLARLLFLGLFFSLCTATQSLAANPSEKLTLASAIQRSMAKHPALQVFKFREIGLQGQVNTAGVRPGFELETELENFFGSDEFTGVDNSEMTISLSSVIEMGDKRQARIGLINDTRAQLDVQRNVAALTLLGEVTSRYIEVLSAQERLRLVKGAAALAEDAFEAVKQRSVAGATPEAEVKRAHAASAQARMQVALERQQLAYYKAALAVLWGESEPAFSAVEGDLFQFGEDVDFQTLYARLENNPSLRIFDSEARLKEAEMHLVKSQAKADIRWTAGLRRFQSSDDAALVAGISIPLWSAQRFQGQEASVAAARDGIPLQKQVVLKKLHTQLHLAFSRRQQAILKTRTLQNEVIPLLEDALNETKSAYDQGRYPYLEWVAARQELLNARSTLIDAATDALRYGAEIEQLTAESLTGVSL